ncbi:MAG: hypothetical protein ACYSOP_02240 [Planctomycetota bacterium]|jgi:hypothetical protein
MVLLTPKRWPKHPNESVAASRLNARIKRAATQSNPNNSARSEANNHRAAVEDLETDPTQKKQTLTNNAKDDRY